ncbi:MAG: hypothetical protein ACRDPY_40015 [Streptosporangiaceae bacterium]
MVTGGCGQPLLSKIWLAAVQVAADRCGGDSGTVAAMGEEAFTGLVRVAVEDWGGKRAWKRISGRVFAALTDTEGVVPWSRHGTRAACQGAGRVRCLPAALNLLHGRLRHQVGRRPVASGAADCQHAPRCQPEAA